MKVEVQQEVEAEGMVETEVEMEEKAVVEQRVDDVEGRFGALRQRSRRMEC